MTCILAHSDYATVDGSTTSSPGGIDTTTNPNLSQNPLFVNSVTRDLRLQYNPSGTSSPCIDYALEGTAGMGRDALDIDNNGNTTLELPLDADRLTRTVDRLPSTPAGRNVDIGAYEVQ